MTGAISRAVDQKPQRTRGEPSTCPGTIRAAEQRPGIAQTPGWADGGTSGLILPLGAPIHIAIQGPGRDSNYLSRSLIQLTGKVPVTPINRPVLIPRALQRVNRALARVVGNEVVAETIETQAASLGPLGITRSVASKMANRVVPSSLTEQVIRERYCQPILP